MGANVSEAAEMPLDSSIHNFQYYLLDMLANCRNHIQKLFYRFHHSIKTIGLCINLTTERFPLFLHRIVAAEGYDLFKLLNRELAPTFFNGFFAALFSVVQARMQQHQPFSSTSIILIIFLYTLISFAYLERLARGKRGKTVHRCELLVFRTFRLPACRKIFFGTL